MAQGIIKGPRLEFFFLQRILHFLRKHYFMETGENKEKDKTWKDKEKEILKDPIMVFKTPDEIFTGPMFVTRDDAHPERVGRTFTYLSDVELHEWILYQYDFIEMGGKYIAYNPTPVT